MTLSGKALLVTGASSGIGKAITEALLVEDATVYGLARRTDQLPSGTIPLACDLKNPDEISSVFSFLRGDNITLHALINNAGLAHLSPVTTGDPQQWQEMWQINVHALALCAQKALPLFPSEGGHLINLSSMSGHRVPPSGGFYAATKFAVRALTEAFRAELKAAGNPTRVTSISPGFVETPLLDIYFKGREDQLAQTKQDIAMLTAEDIAQSVLHALKTPPHVEIQDILLKSSDQKV